MRQPAFPPVAAGDLGFREQLSYLPSRISDAHPAASGLIFSKYAARILEFQKMFYHRRQVTDYAAPLTFAQTLDLLSHVLSVHIFDAAFA
jgi:hypothetical protein